MTFLPNRRAILQGTAAMLLAPAARAAATTGPVIKLRLLETSDLHTFDEDYDYFRDAKDETVGLTKVATLIGTARAEAKNSMLFDNGDIIQGNPLSDYVALPGNFPHDGVHPTIRAMNTLSYDAATIGNHEFNYGLPLFDAALKGANFPFCCANFLKLDGTPYLPPTLILERSFVAEDGSTHKLKIGVIGFVPPQIMDWDRDHLQGRVNTMDIVDAAHVHVPALRKQVDLLIALSHSGISTAPRRGGEENASYYLASVPGIDVIFTGHSHRVFPGPDYEGLEDVDATRGMLGNVPAVMPGFWGSELGVIDLTLAQSPTGWTVTDFTAVTRPIAEREGHAVTSLAANNQAVDEAVAPEHAQTLRWIREPIGRINRPVNSYFAMIGPDASLALVNQAQTWYATPLLPASVQHLPVLSAAAPFKEGYQSPDDYVDLSAGTIAIKNVADLYMYPNTVAAARVTTEELRDWLEHSASVFNQIDPNDPGPQPLLNPHVPSYVFDVISGVTYDIDITQPARFGRGKKHEDARRIVNLRYNGVPVTPEQEFVVITNNYRADSGHIVRSPSDIILRAPDQTRDIISRYILTEKTINIETPRVWSFAPIGQPVTVTFKTSPSAALYLLKQKNITAHGNTDDGYAEFAMTLT